MNGSKTHRSARSAKALLLGFMLAALMSTMLAAGKPAQAGITFTVNSTGDAGTGGCNSTECTLREAIAVTNRVSGADTIRFNIPGSGVKTIKPTSELPAITEAVTMDGYTQPGSSPNTLAKGTNAQINIELDGSGAGSGARGLTISTTASDSVVRGLVINRFDGPGVQIDGNSNIVEGNFIGTDASGTNALGNGGGTARLGGGVFVDGDSNAIGSNLPSQRNLVSGNDDDGVTLEVSADANTVLGNLIGTKKDGKGNLGNEGDGLLVVGSTSNLIGPTDASGANTIAFNGGDGVRIVSFGLATGNRVLRNSIFSNAGLGIDLGGDGLTPNDPGDTDTGPNNLQNKPVLSSATTSSGGTTTVKGKLNSAPNKVFEIHLYSNPSGNEGKKFLGVTNVATDASGNAAFTLSTAQTVAAGQRVTATATSVNGNVGDTSEFSAPKSVVAS
jgi:CSLREA domain-containing protein